MLKLFIAAAFINCAYCRGHGGNIAASVGPLVKATKGEVWPKPQKQEKSENFFLIKPHTFTFEAPENIACTNILDDALRRYWNLLSKAGSLERRGRRLERGRSNTDKQWRSYQKFIGTLGVLNIELAGDCPSDILPQLDDDENYSLALTATEQTLSATTIWGILRGLETFSQLIYLEHDVLIVNATIIDDFPRFSHRGVLLDTARHFQPLFIIYQMLDVMAYNKFNVFHWHITDDQSFPYKSRAFPELSEKGAYHPISRVYEQSDVAKVVEYARRRGIRVIPEFDTPGHTSSWGVSHSELLTTCYQNRKPNGQLGPLDPTKEATYTFLNRLFAEVLDVFPDDFFHIGGDEVDFTCWKSNPNISAFMKAQNITTYENLESFFIQRVVNLMNSLQAKYLVWEEVFVNGANLANSTVVHVWRGDGTETMASVTQAGKFALFSSCWYLDHLETGGDWQKYYECDPQDFPATEEQKKLVLGGEACMWGETINEHNVMSRMWPRASAIAEKLWSSQGVNDVDDASRRLEEHTCRMNFRGIPAQPPNGPGVCL